MSTIFSCYRGVRSLALKAVLIGELEWIAAHSIIDTIVNANEPSQRSLSSSTPRARSGPAPLSLRGSDDESAIANDFGDAALSLFDECAERDEISFGLALKAAIRSENLVRETHCVRNGRARIFIEYARRFAQTLRRLRRGDGGSLCR